MPWVARRTSTPGRGRTAAPPAPAGRARSSTRRARQAARTSRDRQVAGSRSWPGGAQPKVTLVWGHAVSDQDPERCPGAALPDLPAGRDAAAMRSHTAAARAEATRRVVELEGAQQAARDELDAARSRLEEEFARRRAELEGQMAPLRAELARITEIAWTLDLYLGRDEEVTLLRDGRPAA